MGYSTCEVFGLEGSRQTNFSLFTAGQQPLQCPDMSTSEAMHAQYGCKARQTTVSYRHNISCHTVRMRAGGHKLF